MHLLQDPFSVKQRTDYAWWNAHRDMTGSNLMINQIKGKSTGKNFICYNTDPEKLPTI